ncbi:flagellar filament capping protein FliD [Actinokineospora inagensis]|uniref:flagellar filament capping protein FliD n=1 Tax=Actinokineospora inagensis TaxID=103730 RepID=UPI000479592D|nr:flagellar filament capping protein FliD [Actinokineospora inagensis]
MTSSVDGLVSGLNTTTIISQLMTIEAAPQDRLKTKVSDQQTLTSAYQAVNAKMLAVQNATKDLATATTWTAVKGASSSSNVTVSTSSTALTGTATFDVKYLASAHVMTSAVPSSGNVVNGNKLTFTKPDGTSTDVNITTNTAQGVADAINSSSAGVRASVITTTSGQVLQFSATGTGAAKSFTVSGLTNSANVMTQGIDGQVNVGDPNNGGYTLSSSDNSYTGLIPGVTVTATKVESGVTVTTTADPSKAAQAMVNLVNAVNSALSTIDSASAYNPTTKTGGPLTGNALVRSLRESLLSAVSQGTGSGSFAANGVSLSKDGQLTLDQSAFLNSITSDPAGTKANLGTTLGGRYSTLADDNINSTTGKITLVIQAGDSYVRSLNDQISDWDTRLAAKKTALQTQYANLETALGKLKDQASWLSGQLASLPTSSS